MDFLQNSLTFMCLLLVPLVNGGHCSNSNCLIKMAPPSSSYRTEYKIKPIPFPFRSPDQPLSCGLPGFDLTCNGSTTPLLTFPSGQLFSVMYISDPPRKIEVDGGACLQEVLMRFNSSGTPFYAYGGFTRLKVYNCRSTVEYIGSFFDQCWKVDCVRRRDNNSFFCDADADPWSTGLPHRDDCFLEGDVHVAGLWLSAYHFSYARSVYLTWDMPRECVECDSKGKDCGRDPNNPAIIKCFPRPSKTRVRVIISFAVILPVLMIISYVIYKRYKKIRSRNQHSATRLNNAPVSQANLGPTSSSQPVAGIDQATLNTYPIIIIGNSGRILMMMEDKICPICLSDYEPNDIVKYLPECLHRFHYDCIDEWLHQKAVCPICRTIPPLTTS